MSEIEGDVDEVIKKYRDAALLSKNELIDMLRMPSDLSKTYRIMAEANRISK